MHKSFYTSILLLMSFSSVEAAPGDAEPTTQMKSALDKAKQNQLCASSRVAPDVLLHRVGHAYELNAFELSAKRSFLNLPDSVNLEKVVASWMTASEATRATALSAKSQESLRNAINGLGAYLKDSLNNNFDADVGFKVELVPGSPPAPETDIKIIEYIFTGFLTNNAQSPRILILCVPPSTPKTPVAGAEEKDKKAPKLVWSVRNKVDDLSVQKKDKAAFKKLNAASLAFTDNKEKGEETVSVDIVLGIGRQITRNDYLHAFIAYENENTNTDNPDDDDESKDINSLKPGILWARSITAGDANRVQLFGSVGAVLYPTFDFAQDSESLKLRTFANDLVFNVPGFRSALCGGPLDYIGGRLLVDCRLGAFVELGHVFDAGTNVDFQTLEDDQYVGLGGSAGIIIGFDKVGFLKPFTARASYKHMGIVSGPLDDPGRFEASVNYKIGASNFEIGLAYEDGQNFDTFVDEETLKLTAGWKY